MNRIIYSITVLLCLLYLPAAAVQDPVKEISIKAAEGMQYDVLRFIVKPGERVKLTLENSDNMAHNLVVTTPGNREKVANAALELGQKGPAMDYVPNSSDVLWSIPVIYPGEKKSVTFTAPAKPGAYPYVCTYPGHGFVMYGVMYVSEDTAMPDVADDPHIPKHATENQHEDSGMHPYKTIPPYWYRVFMEESSLSTVAVHLPHSLSYAWDTETCQLRVAWSGGFLDNSDLWHGHINGYAHIQGDIFFQDQSPHTPIRMEDGLSAPAINYIGYRIINRYPEFHYTVDGKDVYELIKEMPGGMGLIRTIRIPEANGPVWFLFSGTPTSIYHFALGEQQAGYVKLTAEQAREFTIQMIKK